MVVGAECLTVWVSDDGDLYSERLRRQAMDERAAAGDPFSTTSLDKPVRVKLYAAWRDHTAAIWWHPEASETFGNVESVFSAQVSNMIETSLGESDVRPRKIVSYGFQEWSLSDAVVLFVLEAEHRVLRAEFEHALKAAANDITNPVDEDTSPEAFRRRVNDIFDAHGVAFALTATSEIISRNSEVLHHNVITPTLNLLHDRPEFAVAEGTYLKALDEIRKGDGGDAITDAGTALQDALTALGYPGNTLGEQMKAVKHSGILTGPDSPLSAAVLKIGDWIASRRNHGEAHKGGATATLEDAWFIVHTVGALIVYLADRHGATGP